LQLQLMDPDISVQHEESFCEGLWYLYQVTDKLPPLTNREGHPSLSSYYG
jgi:hypothetical protein